MGVDTGFVSLVGRWAKLEVAPPPPPLFALQNRSRCSRVYLESDQIICVSSKIVRMYVNKRTKGHNPKSRNISLAVFQCFIIPRMIKTDGTCFGNDFISCISTHNFWIANWYSDKIQTANPMFSTMTYSPVTLIDVGRLTESKITDCRPGVSPNSKWWPPNRK